MSTADTHRTQAWVRAQVRRLRLRQIRRKNSRLSAEEVFSDIYERGLWRAAFSSGSGSSGEPAVEYGKLISDLIAKLDLRSAVDIGCGDYMVAAQFADQLDSYLGIDVAPNMIDRNRTRFESEKISFRQLDVATSKPPPADVCLIRQVLQHLSNQQIARILRNTSHYPRVVITEHWPADGHRLTPNIDKPHGPDTRLDMDSWVDLSAPPFNLGVTELLSVTASPLYSAGETIRTFMWTPGEAE